MTEKQSLINICNAISNKADLLEGEALKNKSKITLKESDEIREFVFMLIDHIVEYHGRWGL